MPDEEHRYKIAYQVELPENGITKEELAERRVGGCDCIVVASIIGRPGGPGGLSTVIVSLDGFTGGDLTPEQQFQIWSTWAHALMEQLPEGTRKDICREAFKAVKTRILGQE